MSGDPVVCCVMLVNGRAAMTKRAIESFRAQTYEAKHLLLYDTTSQMMPLDSAGCTHLCAYHEDGKLSHTEAAAVQRGTIGPLRNRANELAAWRVKGHQLIAHFDSDDYSHPRRLEEQVALLQASGKMCVGYRELLFWDTRPLTRIIASMTTEVGPDVQLKDEPMKDGEAWLYRSDYPNWAAGASLTYRRDLWEQQPFDNAPHEDQRWWLTPLVSRNCLGVSANDQYDTQPRVEGGRAAWQTQVEDQGEPRMICQIHGANTEAYLRADMQRAPEWRRAPEWDKYCAERMAL